MAGTGLDELAWEPGSGPDLSFTTELAVTQSFLYLGLYLSSDLLRPHFGKWKPTWSLETSAGGKQPLWSRGLW